MEESGEGRPFGILACLDDLSLLQELGYAYARRLVNLNRSIMYPVQFVVMGDGCCKCIKVFQMRY